MMTTVYLGIGGNLGRPRETLERAIEKLRQDAAIAVTSISRYYRSAPVGGPADQPEYINAVIAIETAQTARQMLDLCLATEIIFGRIRNERWSPRTLDIDILLYGDQRIKETSLTVPHPRLRERLFVLLPLSDVAPADLNIPPNGDLLHEVLNKALIDPNISTQRVELSV